MTIGMLITELEILLTKESITTNTEIIIQTSGIHDANLSLNLVTVDGEDNCIFITKEI
jgi:hypothetical protein